MLPLQDQTVKLFFIPCHTDRYPISRTARVVGRMKKRHMQFYETSAVWFRLNSCSHFEPILASQKLCQNKNSNLILISCWILHLFDAILVALANCCTWQFWRRCAINSVSPITETVRSQQGFRELLAGRIFLNKSTYRGPFILHQTNWCRSTCLQEWQMYGLVH